MWGIGFKTADTIARSVGIAPDSPERIKVGLAYTLSEAARLRALQLDPSPCGEKTRAPARKIQKNSQAQPGRPDVVTGSAP